MSESTEAQNRILVAEDTPSIATFVSTLLTHRGYQVELATDGEQCLQKARAFAPNLILLDIMLPKIHGMEVLRRLKADVQTRSIAVIMCTARKYKPDQDQAMELGARDILFKPFDKQEMLETVARFFSGAEAQKPIHQETAPGEISPNNSPIESLNLIGHKAEEDIPSPGGEGRVRAIPGKGVHGEAYLPRIAPSRPYYRLWGTRGSIPVSGNRYARHGGNTSCLEVGFGDDRIIVDAGSGIRELGLELVRQGPRRLHIFITHTHWDHIQGFPFFAPAYVPGFEVVLYGAAGFGKDLKSIFTSQLDRDCFPVQFQDMRAKIEFRNLEEPPLDLGGLRLWWELTNHPGATLCFKFQMDNKMLAYLTDNEFLYGYLGAPQQITLNSQELAPHRALVDFLTGTDLLIGEAQYTNEEYRDKVGWGHSSLSNACALARLAKVGAWIVTHYDPLHDDGFLDQKLNLTKEILRDLDFPIQVTHAHDEMAGYL